VWKILRRRAALANSTVHESERLSPHGLRAGFITEAYLRGALDEQVMHHTRQKSLATTQGYRRRAKLTGGLVGEWPDLRLGHGGEAGVDLIGLGAQAESTREGADLGGLTTMTGSPAAPRMAVATVS
jgi:hypothetical protein